jgi:hypothetical protein
MVQKSNPGYRLFQIGRHSEKERERTTIRSFFRDLPLTKVLAAGLGSPFRRPEVTEGLPFLAGEPVRPVFPIPIISSGRRRVLQCPNCLPRACTLPELNSRVLLSLLPVGNFQS